MLFLSLENDLAVISSSLYSISANLWLLSLSLTHEMSCHEPTSETSFDRISDLDTTAS